MNEERVTLPRWQSLFAALRCGAADPLQFQRLVAAWREPHRRYHTLAHLEACLAEFDRVCELAERPAEVELALWFHDAVYVARRDDNERRSAEWMRHVLRAAVVPDAVALRIERHILATRHAGGGAPEGPRTGDTALVVDIDLAVLGRAETEYEDYQRAVRAEHPWVPGFLYRRGRRRVLQDLAAHPSIYATPAFRERYEQAARGNLERELAKLS